jgi:hypothetical protein
MIKGKENEYWNIILSQKLKVQNYLLQAVTVFTNTRDKT